MRLAEITLRQLRLALHTPYRLSYRTFTEFEPILVEARDADGRVGWGEGHISPGSSRETRDGGWEFCREQAQRIVGGTVAAGKVRLGAALERSPVAGCAMLTALEMLEGERLLAPGRELRLKLLTPFDATQGAAIAQEVERRLGGGFTTFKIKVGSDVEADLARVRAIQRAAAGRASLRIDANRGYDAAQGCRFAAALDPAGIELFEQPCAAEDWAANERVAAVSTVPLMLDEPICSLSDIERAGQIAGVGYCKLKLKRFGGLERLRLALERVRECGMEPVLGDGLGGEIGCWMEACVAAVTIGNAGEFNGFLKSATRLLDPSLGFAAGALVVPEGFTPQVDRAALAAHEIVRERFAPPLT